MSDLEVWCLGGILGVVVTIMLASVVAESLREKDEDE